MKFLECITRVRNRLTEIQIILSRNNRTSTDSNFHIPRGNFWPNFRRTAVECDQVRYNLVGFFLRCLPFRDFQIIFSLCNRRSIVASHWFMGARNVAAAYFDVTTSITASNFSHHNPQRRSYLVSTSSFRTLENEASQSASTSSTPR